MYCVPFDVLGKGSKFQDTVTQPQLTPRPTPRDAFLCNFPRTSRGKPAREPRATTNQSDNLLLRMHCKHTMKDSYSESRLERPTLQPRVHLISASKCLAWSTLTVVPATIDGSEGASALVGRAGSGVVSDGCSKCAWCMNAPCHQLHTTRIASCDKGWARSECAESSCFLRCDEAASCRSTTARLACASRKKSTVPNSSYAAWPPL